MNLRSVSHLVIRANPQPPWQTSVAVCSQGQTAETEPRMGACDLLGVSPHIYVHSAHLCTTAVLNAAAATADAPENKHCGAFVCPGAREV